MSLPELLESALDGEPSVSQVQLGGEDVLVVTPNRTVVYRADGLLSDESIESYPHAAEQLTEPVQNTQRRRQSSPRGHRRSGL